MKLPPYSRPAFRRDAPHARDVAATIGATLERAFRDAGLAGSGVEPAIRATIDDALAAAGLVAPTAARTTTPTAGPSATTACDQRGGDARRHTHSTPGATYEGHARVVTDDHAGVHEPAAPRRDLRPTGRFTAGSFTHAAGTRGYKLYVPANAARRALVVMLHGCTQSPDDFAAGTRMNALADREGLVVLYPAQDAAANPSRCWNWFRPADQHRGQGEPAILAGMAQSVGRAHGIDARCVFVAGLSAGAAMAVILGATFPDVFAAVGAHSGLPYRSAHDMPSAFAVMHGRQRPRRTDGAHANSPFVPTIVFHGDADQTVVPANGEAIVAGLEMARTQDISSSHRDARTADGTRYRQTVYTTAQGDIVAEHWVIEGAGHAWSGGSRAGSFTEPTGPDASAEMVRFFLATRTSARVLPTAA